MQRFRSIGGCRAQLAPQRLPLSPPTAWSTSIGVHKLAGKGVEPGDALVVATSGTTRAPRGVVLTHDAVRASAVATSARLGVTHTDTWLACLPLSHIGGLSVIARSLVTRNAVGRPRRLRCLRAVADAARNGATLVSLVATALRRIDPMLFRRVVVGGSRPPSEPADNVIATYGMTETGSGVVYDGVPLDDVEVRVDTEGEIHVRCPMLARCYRDGPIAVVDGWFATGDLGEIGSHGRLVVHGRRDELIITGGENVFPTAVEVAVAGHPGVAEVAVAGVPDLEWGERVVAWIVPTDRSAPPTLAAIRALTAESLPSFMAPKEVRIVESLPTTTSGKVRRHQLPRYD